jgi:hypothetical protein
MSRLATTVVFAVGANVLGLHSRDALESFCDALQTGDT